jgi:hypothetical protein
VTGFRAHDEAHADHRHHGHIPPSTFRSPTVTTPSPSERAEIIDTCTRLFWLTDRRDWDGLRRVMGDRVRLDYTSLNGGELATMSGNEVIAGWRGVLGNLAATQHLVSNHLVDMHDQTATCTAAFQATHVLPNPHGDPIWTLGGHYLLELAHTPDGWRITAMTMIADWATGNQQIMSLAAGAANPAPSETSSLDGAERLQPR